MAGKDILKSHDLFVFDWDGTLSSMRLLLRINESLKRLFRRWNVDSAYGDFSHMDGAARLRLRSEERRNNLMTFTFDIFLNLSRPRLHNDAVRLLKLLKKRGKKVAIFSNGRSSRVKKELRMLGIYNLFDFVISARDLNALKPNPAGLKMLLQPSNVSPSRSLYIGDMVDDMMAARLAHMRSCAMADGFDSYRKLRSTKPDYIFRSIEALLRALS